MQNIPEERFDRRRFLKNSMPTINRSGLIEVFKQTNYRRAITLPRETSQGDIRDDS